MAPPGTGPKLPFGLLQQIGSTKQKRTRQNHTKLPLSRKDDHNEDLTRKPSHIGNHVTISDKGASRKEGTLAVSRKHNFRSSKTPNPAAKETLQGSHTDSGSGLISVDAILSGCHEDEEQDNVENEGEGEDDDDDGSGREEEEGTVDAEDSEVGDRSDPRIPSKAVRDRLAKDDAEIAALEKKLGVRARKLPKSFQEDGLEYLLGDLGNDSHDKVEVFSSKRKTEDEDWLARKRKKSGKSERVGSLKTANLGDGRLGEGLDTVDYDHSKPDPVEGPDHDADDTLQSLDSDGFEGFDSADTASWTPEPAVCRPRENPYVAPSTGNIAKYVPPAARQDSGTDAEMTAKIRRLAQGLMNRMIDSNLLTILGDVDELYRNYPRHHVSSTIVALLLTRICEPTAVLDKYLVLYGGFATAIYKLHGVDFGASLVQGVVDSFDRHYQAAVRDSSSGPSTKEALNLVGFISQLYSFQLIGANLVFDYIRLLLGNLSELNAELLLRVVRTSGSSLRQDDPLSLKDIVTLIRPAVARVGERNISVRTRFMIETINDLKNNKIKAGTTSAKHADHMTRMKKLLGSLKSRKLKSTEPLRIGLREIRESDRKGKWWLVGASWTGNLHDGAGERNEASRHDEEVGDDHFGFTGEDVDLPDLWKLAREQNMNTGTQQAIFVALLSSADYQEACTKIHKLRLNKDRRGEISTVLVQCVGAEEHYNPYYTLAAGKLCSADRKVKYSFQDSLWKFFRRLGQPLFDDEMDEADEDETIDVRRIVNVAKMFGSLVARGVLGLSILKCVDMAYLRAKPKTFVEVMLVSCLLELDEGAVKRAFRAETQELAQGLRWFLRTVVRKTDLVDHRERKAFRSSCKSAEKAVRGALVAEVGHASEDD